MEPVVARSRQSKGNTAGKDYRLFRSSSGKITPMKIKMDKQADALYFRLDENRIVESEEIKPGVILDYDEADQVVGVEFLGVSVRASAEELSSLEFKTA